MAVRVVTGNTIAWPALVDPAKGHFVLQVWRGRNLLSDGRRFLLFIEPTYIQRTRNEYLKCPQANAVVLRPGLSDAAVKKCLEHGWPSKTRHVREILDV
jgi:hypothetical protein